MPAGKIIKLTHIQNPAINVAIVAAKIVAVIVVAMKMGQN